MKEEEKQLAWRAAERRIVAMALMAVLASTVAVFPLLLIADPAAAGLGPRPSQAGRILRIGVSDLTAVTLNPNAITLLLEFIPVYIVYSTLATRDQNLVLAPDLASSWEVAGDNVTWTFHLVQNAYFTDPASPTSKNRPVTADDVVFSYNMVKNNNVSVLWLWVEPLLTITKVDTYTVRIVTDGPYAAMSSTISTIPIFPKYLWESVIDPVADQPLAYPVGSGAMYYDPNSDLSSGPIILHRSPNYHGDALYCQKSRPDEVRFILYTASGTMIEDFGSGTSRLDAIFNIPAASFVSAAALNQPTVTKIQVSGGFVAELSSNVLTAALRQQYIAAGFTDFELGSNSQILVENLVVRQAIARSVDRNAIIRYAYQGLATVGDTLVPASNPWHYDIPPEDEFVFDTAAARQLLNAAGWTYDSTGSLNPGATPLYKAGVTDGLIFRFYAPDSHLEFEPAVANISAWLRQTGIVTTDSRGDPAVGYEVKPVNEMNSIWAALDYDIWLWDWIFSRTSDPTVDVLSVQITDAIGVGNDNGYTNATFDALYQESLATFDVDARRAITDEMQRMIYDYASYFLPYYPNDLYAVTSDPTLGFGWRDWGDWPTQPGLTVDSTLPNLFFHIAPPDNRPPVIASFPSIEYVAGSETTFGVIASDPDDTSLTFTWDFGDGTNPTTTTGNTVAHTFANPGTYAVRVRVADSEWPVCATATATISPAAANLPPVATLDIHFPVAGHGWEDESLTLEVTVRDSEGDPLYIVWDFGDQTSATDYVTSTATNTPVTQTHTYANPGNYSLRVSATDNETGTGHVQVRTATVSIWSRPTGGGPAGAGGLDPLVNYGVPLGILAVILIAATVVLVRRRRMRKAEEGQEEASREQPPPPSS